MDVTNIDGANGNEAPGFKNAPKIIEDCYNAADDIFFNRQTSEVRYTPIGAGIYGTIEALRKRGLLTSQALELLQRDGDLTPLTGDRK